MAKLSHEERVKALEERLGVSFADPALALCALTHKSYVNEHKDHEAPHNERLEFLGDAVVDLAVSHRLMERFPEAHEGALSKMRAMAVNEEALAQVARTLKLGELLLLGKGEDRSGGREKSSVLADAFEAVIGAVYLGGGLDAALKLVDAHFAPLLEPANGGVAGGDHKTRLQELVQSRRQPAPRYRIVAQTGPEHLKEFEVEVEIGDQVLGRAKGRSKKEAEQAAARAALGTLEQHDSAEG